MFTTNPNKEVTLFPGGARATKKVKDALLRLLPKSSFVFCNRGELLGWAAVLEWDADPALRLAGMLRPAGVAVVTAGAEATMLAHKGEVHSFPVPPTLDIGRCRESTCLHSFCTCAIRVCVMFLS